MWKKKEVKVIDREKGLRDLFADFSFEFFTNGVYNLNIFGIRAENRQGNGFNDLICIACNTEAGFYTEAFQATVDPGSSVLGDEKMGNENGTALLPSSTLNDQYKFVIGSHKGKYPAFNQAEEFTIVRDDNGDGKLLTQKDIAEKINSGDVHTGWFGINMHHASSSGVSVSVNDWSWGCQVIQSIFDWNKLWAIINKSADIYGSKFTYTLFEESDIKLSLGVDISEFYGIINNNRVV